MADKKVNSRRRKRLQKSGDLQRNLIVLLVDHRHPLAHERLVDKSVPLKEAKLSDALKPSEPSGVALKEPKLGDPLKQSDTLKQSVPLKELGHALGTKLSNVPLKELDTVPLRLPCNALVLPLTPSKTISHWRDYNEEIHLLFGAIVLRHTGSVFPFTLRLSYEIADKALGDATPCNYIHRRLAHHLNKALSRDVAFFQVTELDDAGRPHLHGQIAISEGEFEKARQALKSAGGKWIGPEPERQLHMPRSKKNPNLNHVGYCTKQLLHQRINRLLQRKNWHDRFIPKTLPGQMISMPNSLRGDAKELFAEFRKSVLT
jgi:hypothetical protein